MGTESVSTGNKDINKLCNINLYKNYLNKTLFSFAKKRTFYVVMVIVIQIFLMAFITFYVSRIKKSSEETLIMAQKHGLSVHLPSNLKEMKEVAISVAKMKAQRSALLDLLNDIVKEMPSDVWLNSLHLDDNGIISVRGTSFTASSIAEYMSRLSKSDKVKSVVFGNGGLRRNKDGTYSFSFLITTTWHRKKGKRHG